MLLERGGGGGGGGRGSCEIFEGKEGHHWGVGVCVHGRVRKLSFFQDIFIFRPRFASNCSKLM